MVGVFMIVNMKQLVKFHINKEQAGMIIPTVLPGTNMPILMLMYKCYKKDRWYPFLGTWYKCYYDSNAYNTTVLNQVKCTNNGKLPWQPGYLMTSPFIADGKRGYEKNAAWFKDLSRVAEKVYKEGLAPLKVTESDLLGGDYAIAVYSFHKQPNIETLCEFLFKKGAV